MFIVNSGGQIEFANAAFSRLSGFSQDQLLGRDPSMFKSGLTPDSVFEDMWRALIAGHNWSGEFQNKRQDGSNYWAAANVSIVRDRNGAASHYICVIQDLTAQKQAEARSEALTEQLHQSQKMEALGALASGIAHDFNNLLAIISGFSHAGLNDLPPEHPVVRDFRNILMAVDRGKELARRILTFSRRGMNKPRTVNLGQAVSDGLKMARAAIPAAISIRKRFPQGRVLVLGDETEWHQIITNLCINSAQAIGERSGEIEVELRFDDEADAFGHGFARRFVEFAIHDSGPGIAAEDLPRIFDPFFSTKHRGEGTGLGLTIVHSIVAKSGGRIWAENRKSAGATIRIKIPLLAEAERASASAPQVEGGRIGCAAKLLAPSRKARGQKIAAALANFAAAGG
jgi:PAS domain S-box-containing protein